MEIPSGTILLWSGAIVDIPVGFVLCDGTSGTPDLRDKFIVGAGLTYAVDDTGGNVNHNHPFTGDGHLHTIPADIFIASGAGYANQTSLNAASGTTDNANGLPPYHALAYIMKT